MSPTSLFLSRLEAIHRDVLGGATEIAVALGEARALAELHDISEAFDSLASTAISTSSTDKWLGAAIKWRLVLEIVDSSREDVKRRVTPSACSVWLNVAANVLAIRADAKLLADARKRAGAVIDGFIAEHNAASAAYFRHQLGVLLLDPYIHSRTAGMTDRGAFVRSVRRWSDDGRDNPLELALEKAGPMPSAAEALGESARILRLAADSRRGRERGKSLKALFGAVYWRGVAIGERDTSLLIGIANEALHLLDSDQDAEHIMWVHQYLAILQPTAPNNHQSDADRAFDSDAMAGARRDLHEAIARKDDALQLSLIFNLSNITATRLRLWEHIPARRTGFLRLFRPSLHRARVTKDWQTRADWLLESAESEGWCAHDLALGAIWLGQRGSAHDVESVGIELIRKVARCGAPMSEDIYHALALARAILQINYGATCRRRRQVSAAFCSYLEAARSLCALELPVRAKEAYDRALDMADRLKRPYDADVVATLAATSALIEGLLYTESLSLRRLWRGVLTDVAFSTPRFAWIFLVQAAKAALLPLWRANQAADNVLRRDSVKAACEQWKANPVDTLPADFAVDQVGVPDLETLLSAYHDTGDKPGKNAKERAFNLQRQFDRGLTRELSKTAAAEPSWLSLEQLRASLTEKTVLLSIISCPTPEGGMGSVTLLVTRDECKVVMGTSSVPAFSTDIGGVWTDAIANAVAEFRRHLQRKIPTVAPQPVRATLSDFVFGPVRQDLLRLHEQGFRHLCVNPVGALHYCPLSVLDLTEHSIGLDWTITNLPALAMIRPRDAAGPIAPRLGGAAFGVTFKGRCNGLHGLMPLDSVEAEISTLAEEGGLEKYLDDQATPSALNEAFRRMRYVHIATHGRHDPAAPAFQTLYLYPEIEHDGVYRAFEVLGHQLDGLDLVTLGACETALGRVDAGDNSRGLQAFLLVAGASSVISCLWPVYDDVSRLFFARLYSHLAAGAGKLAAYERALHETRKRYPAPDEWGTFQYSGSW